MSRKNYIAIAAAFKRTQPQPGTSTAKEYEQWARDVFAIAGVLKADNPAFDSERFYEAAGVITEGD